MHIWDIVPMPGRMNIPTNSHSTTSEWCVMHACSHVLVHSDRHDYTNLHIPSDNQNTNTNGTQTDIAWRTSNVSACTKISAFAVAEKPPCMFAIYSHILHYSIYATNALGLAHRKPASYMPKIQTLFSRAMKVKPYTFVRSHSSAPHQAHMCTQHIQIVAKILANKYSICT